MFNIVDYFRRSCQFSSLHQYKVRNIEDVIIKLTTYGNLIFEDIQGCTEEEILEVEAQFGKLPVVYKNIMMTIGKGIRNSDRSKTSRRDDFYLNEVLDLSYTMTEVDPLEESAEVDTPFPENIFFIYDIYAVCVYFLITNKDDDDTSVFVEDFKKRYSYDEEYVFVKAYDSIWDWIDDYLEMKI